MASVARRSSKVGGAAGAGV